MAEIYKLDVEVKGNPAGFVHSLTEIDDKIAELLAKWRAEVAKTAWWKLWAKPNLYKITRFLLDSLDDFIHLVDKLVEDGADKKATVLKALEVIYDNIVAEAMPIMLRPFSKGIKQFIIYTVISTMIDWVVDKYRNGAWRKTVEDIIKEENGEEETTTEEKPEETQP